jgi:hypothetical protein
MVRGAKTNKSIRRVKGENGRISKPQQRLVLYSQTPSLNKYHNTITTQKLIGNSRSPKQHQSLVFDLRLLRKTWIFCLRSRRKPNKLISLLVYFMY